MKTKIAALGVSALMLIMVAVPAVTADQFEDAQARYAAAKQTYLDAQAEALKARGEFLSARERWRGNRSGGNFSGMVKAAGVTVQAQSTVMIRYMEMNRVQIEATRGLSDNQKVPIYAEIDGYINELRAKQERVRNTDNDQQIRNAAGEIERYWLQIRVRLKQIEATLILASVEAMVQRIEAFAGQIEAKVQQLKDNGVNTAELENWVGNLRNRLNLAEQRIVDAWAKVDQITDNVTFMGIFKAAMVRVRETLAYLKDALNSLKDILAQIRNRGQQVTIRGSGTLMANGNGRVLITGTGTILVRSTIQGELNVSDNANVTTVGVGEKNALGNGLTQYKGYSSVRIVGTGITVDINGNGINIFASGSGVAKLSGSGSYATQGENFYVSGTWTASGVSLRIETGQLG